ncbi:MAG TPA: hypothetical protein VFP23_08015, partial [Solirubrobacterales bacterium]|nr:hypothetical protein [Solirubrobacterales bacterium]
WIAGKDGDHLDISYEAGGAFATLEGQGKLSLSLDGSEPTPIEIDGPALYPLVEHPRHEAHHLTLRPSPGLKVWSISFAAGVP